jgi:hypothetical protein
MALKPWYKVVTPREDLREGRPLDASEFAVHLDHVRDQRAPADYQKPDRFFDRTFLTKNLTAVAVETVRRLSGIKVETSAVFNLTTQFGGGKTHALTLLYHLANGGPDAAKWKGVPFVLEEAGVKSIPKTAVAVFVGTEFDSITGRGGKDGTPVRFTPWGEIAYQIGTSGGGPKAGAKAFAVVAKHDADRTAPSSEVIRQFLPKGQPVLILMDELLNYMGRNRKSGLTNQLYSFLQNLSEEARAQDRTVLAVSLPSLLDEMTQDDEADFERFQKMLDRLGKAMIMSAEHETSEIIRRRLFEWGGLPDDGKKTAAEYGEFILSNRTQFPGWFPVDTAKEAFSATYPLHPTLLSVFERKWQQLPRFQQTRGILRLLALWVSHAYQAGFKGAHKDPLISMGTAPLQDPLFRSAAFEQLGGAKLEGAVTTDICGKKESHAVRLDAESIETIKKARLHQKVATAIFFESNGGQLKTEATLPEIRLAVAEPEIELGHIETVLETLASTCYYLSADKNRYRFSLSPNLNKLLADRGASVQPKKVDERIRAEVQKVFTGGPTIDRVFFPEKSGQIPDRAAITLVVLLPEQTITEGSTLDFIKAATKDHGSSGRTFKSGILWAVPESPNALRDDGRKVLAWEDIEDEKSDLRLDESQLRQLDESLKKARRDVKESVWRTYKNLVLLGKDNTWKTIDMGLVHSSAATTIVDLIVERLVREGDIEDKSVSPNFLTRNWPPALTEWSTKSARDAFFASPAFPRLLIPDSLKETISRGVENRILGYVGKKPDGSYDPFHWKSSVAALDVELSDDVYVIQKETAEEYAAGKLPKAPGPLVPPPEPEPVKSGPILHPEPVSPGGPAPAAALTRIAWRGEVPAQKWMNFYTKILAKFAAQNGLRIELNVEIAPEGGISRQRLDEVKVALRELGLSDEVDSSS